MRVVEGDEGTDSETPSDVVVKSGDLAVKATTNNGGVILAEGVSDMDTLTFKTSEEVEITKVVLERYGYSKNENVEKIWLEDENGVIISNEVESLNSKAQATLTLKKDYRKVDGTLNATVVIQADAEAWNTIWFKVVDVTSSAKNVDLGDYNPYTYSVVNYDGADLIITTRSADKTYNWEAWESYEVAKFKLKAPSDSAINVMSFTLTDNDNNAIEYDDYIEDVKVTVAGKEVKSSYNINKDDELVINLSNVELAAKDNLEFVVSVKLADGFDNMWKSVNFYIAKASDISATDKKTNSRVLVKVLADNEDGRADYKWVASQWYKVKFEGGKVKITSKKLGNVEASEDSTDIVIAEWEISTSQTIKAGKWVIKVTVKNSGDKVVRAMRLEIAWDEYEGSLAGNVFSFPAVDVDKSGKIRILVDTVESWNENDYATFTISGLKWTTTSNGFYYEDSKTVADVAGSLNISRLTLAASKASLTNKISSDEVEFKGGENSDEETILSWSYTAKKRDVYLNEFVLSGADNQWTGVHEMTVYLYLDWEPVADAELVLTGNEWIATDTFSNTLVKAGESINVELRAQVEAADVVDEDGKPMNERILSAKKFTLFLRWEDENGNNPSGKADKQTSKISVVNKWTPEIKTSKSKDTVLLRWSDDAIAEFTVKPSWANSLDLESVSFTEPNGVNCSNLKLEWAVDEDLILKNGKCVADGFVETIWQAGEVLRIVFDDEPIENSNLIEVEIAGLEINGKPMSNTFSKAYADATISFTQTNNKSYTKYVVNVLDTYNGSTELSDLHLYNANEKEFKTSLKANSTLSEWDEFTIENLSDSEKIEKIVYTVTRGSFTQIVTVKYSDYPDYFKTNDDDLRVYDNGKDSDGDGKTNKVE